jgi:hypothetical protein
MDDIPMRVPCKGDDTVMVQDLHHRLVARLESTEGTFFSSKDMLRRLTDDLTTE